MSYRVSEIFTSIQGEGFYSGHKATFLRFSGCNLDCHFCDTDHSLHHLLTMDEIVDELAAVSSRKLLVLTGGEPLLQVNGEFMLAVKPMFDFVAIETNGTQLVPMSVQEHHPWITVSPKNPEGPWPALRQANEVKIVVPGNGWTLDRLDVLEKVAQTAILTLQPEWGERYEDAIKWMTDVVMARPSWAASVQLHRILGLP